ncbi:MAG: hypothetical protein AAF587_08955 [Bacteroidota bacterium]
MSKKKKNPSPDGRIARVPIRGKDPVKWHELKDKLKDKLALAVDQTLNSIIDPVEGTTLKEEFQELSHQVLGYAKAKLAEPGISNRKALAEIEECLARCKKEVAEAQKTHLESEMLKFNLDVKRLIMSLGATKIFILSDDNGEESVLFVKKIDQFLELLKMITA